MYFSIKITRWGFGPLFRGFKLGFNQHTHRFSAPLWHLRKWNSNSLTHKAAAWDEPTFSIRQACPQREVVILVPKESHFLSIPVHIPVQPLIMQRTYDKRQRHNPTHWTLWTVALMQELCLHVELKIELHQESIILIYWVIISITVTLVLTWFTAENDRKKIAQCKLQKVTNAK